jgi:hypothetical protein
LVAGSFRALKRAVEAALARSDFERALGHVLETVEYAAALAQDRRLMCHGSLELDRLCADIGARLRQSGIVPETRPGDDATAAPPGDVYIASELYRDGGHTGLIGDYVRANPHRRPVVLVTDIANRQGSIPDVVSDRLFVPKEAVEVCREPSLVGKFRWLDGRLDTLAADRVFLVNHMQDCVAVAAADPRPNRQWWFVHHSNRLPCLGARNPDLIHADVTPFCFCHCRSQGLGPKHRYVPLTAFDQGCRDFGRRPAARSLTTASAGSAHKFPLDYRPGYEETVARLVERTGGRHVHIGPLAGRQLRLVRERLSARGLPQESFVHVPFVPSVWKAMALYDVDLYVSSFPLPGARTSVEVMGSGTPAVWHRASELSLFQATSMKYPEAVIWDEPAELEALVDRIDPQWLRAQSASARRHFERAHRGDVVRACLDGRTRHCEPECPPEEAGRGPESVGLDALLPARNVMRRLRRRVSAIFPADG